MSRSARGCCTRVRTWRSSGWAGDERLEPERAERAAVVGHDRDDRQQLAGLGIDRAVLAQWVAEHRLVVGQGELDGVDRVVLVRGRGDVERMLVLGPVVPAAGQPPGAAGGGLELGEVQLPDLVRAGRLVANAALRALGELAAFALVVRRAGSGPRRAAAAARSPRTPRARRGGPSPRSCGAPTPGAPARACQHPLARPLAGRPRPRPLRPAASAGLGLPAAPGPLGHVDQLAEPRGRHARLDADHLEVLEGPSRPSADFFHTRSSTAASPSAWVRSATSASSCCSRVDGPDLPAASASCRPRGSRPSTGRSTAR